MKPRQLLLAGALAVAGWLAFFGDKTPANDIAEPLAQRQAVAAAAVKAEPAAPRGVTRAAAKTAPSSAPDILALRPREELIGGARIVETAALFASQSWAPPPPPPSLPTTSIQEASPEPVLPPPPFTYLGKKAEDGVWEVYLARGDKTHIVREKNVIDGTYRVESIKPPTLSFTYMPANALQEFAIGGAE